MTDKIGQLFKKYGIKSITMDDIARELGMSKKTLYQLVSEKNELVDIVLTSEFHYFKEKLQKIKNKSHDAVLQLININALLYEFLCEFSQAANYDLQKYHPAIYDRIHEDYVTMFLTVIHENLVKGKSEKVFRIELDENIISKLLLSRIEQIQNSKIFKPEEFKSPRFVQEICRYHLHGIINKQGEKLLKKYNYEIENISKPEAI